MIPDPEPGTDRLMRIEGQYSCAGAAARILDDSFRRHLSFYRANWYFSFKRKACYFKHYSLQMSLFIFSCNLHMKNPKTEGRKL